LNPLNAFLRRPGDRADFAQDVVSYGPGGCFTATLFHRIGDWTQLVETQAGALEQHIGRSFYVLNFICQIHCRLFASTFLSLVAIFECIAFKHASNDVDALFHYSRWADFFTFPFADFLHENLRGSKAKQKAVSGDVLHYTGFHRDLHRMPRVGRNNSPPKLNAPRLRCNHSQDRSRGTRLESVLTPPRV